MTTNTSGWVKEAKYIPEGRPARQAPAVVKSGRTVQLSVYAPDELPPSVDIYTDGDRIAFDFGDGRAYKVWRPAMRSKHAHCSIPHRFFDRFPAGTTVVRLDREGDMLVLDLAQFSTAAPARKVWSLGA